MKKELIFKIARYLLAFMMIVFGANKFLGFIDMPPPEGKLAQQFMGAMFTTYLVKVVATTQIIGGVLLMIPRTAFIGLLIMLPIIVNIVGYHLFHDMPGNGLWLIVLFLFIVIIAELKTYFSNLLINPSNK